MLTSGAGGGGGGRMLGRFGRTLDAAGDEYTAGRATHARRHFQVATLDVAAKR